MTQFTYFDESFRYAEDYPAFEWAEFQEALADDLEASSARATGVALRFAVACVDPKDRERFRRVSRKNKAKIDDWMVVFRDWTTEETERPTGQPTDSTDGLEVTPESSGSQPVASVTSLPEPAAEPRQLRPDLALAIARSA